MTTQQQKVALIIGATGGIGSQIALQLAKTGTIIGIHYMNHIEKAQQLEADITSLGQTARIYKGNVSNEAEMTSIFEALIREFGKIDILINTAGIMRLSKIEALPMEELDRIYDTNIKGTFVLSKLAALNLNSNGSLVNFSTSVTKLQLPSYGAYAASKAAVEAITLILARELRGKGIRVNTIAPGPTATELFFHGKPQDVIDQMSKASPLERLGEPSDIATAVVNLVTSDTWTNGQIIYVNGGII